MASAGDSGAKRGGSRRYTRLDMWARSPGAGVDGDGAGTLWLAFGDENEGVGAYGGRFGCETRGERVDKRDNVALARADAFSCAGTAGTAEDGRTWDCTCNSRCDARVFPLSRCLFLLCFVCDA
jgi:hypothetical protein